jgi:hypothetical protein
MIKSNSNIARMTLVLSLFIFNNFGDNHIAMAGDCNTLNSEFNRGEVFKLLRSGGFSGVLNQKIELNKVGEVKIGNTCLNLFVYVHTSKTKRGSTGAQHMAKRLFILSKSHYLGMYTLDEIPTRLTGKTLEFPGEKDEGNTIVFDSETPPEKIYLNGEVRKLFK